MVIEGNQKEKEAMEQFHKGNRQEGLRLQEEFAAAFREEYKDKDHCPCKKACRYHGNCKECVAIHRAHQEHLPNCMRPVVNAKIKLLSELTEHTIANEIEPPNGVSVIKDRKILFSQNGLSNTKNLAGFCHARFSYFYS